MKRWPYAAAEAELVTLFTMRESLGAQNIDSDGSASLTGDMKASNLQERMAAMFDARRRDDFLTRDDEIKNTFAACDESTRWWCTRAYAPRHFTEKLSVAFDAQTLEGVRRLKLLPLTKAAAEIVCADALREWEVLNAALEREVKKHKPSVDKDVERAWRLVVEKRALNIGALHVRAHGIPSESEIYAHFERVAGMQKFDEGGRRRAVDRRIAAVENDADRLIVPPLEVYETLRRARKNLKSHARRKEIAAIRGGTT